MRPLADLIRLADQNSGRIPGTIPEHYVQWALASHRHQRNLGQPQRPVDSLAKKHVGPVSKPRPAVIYL